MTSAAVRLVLVEGASGEGATIDHDEFDVTTVREVAAASPPEHVVAAVSGTVAIASAGAWIGPAPRKWVRAHSGEPAMIISAAL